MKTDPPTLIGYAVHLGIVRTAVNDALERAAQEIECERAAGDSYEAKRINAEIAGYALAIRNLKETIP